MVLEVVVWGVQSPDALAWMTPPPKGAWQSGQALLEQLGIIDSAAKLTPLGKQSALWPVELRLAVMLERSSSLSALPLACGVAALLERRPFTRGFSTAICLAFALSSVAKGG